MHRAATGSSSLDEFLNIFFRHKTKALLTFLVFCSLAVFIALFFPRTYLSEAKLYVRIGRESISLDPTATTGQTVMMQKSQEAEINSVLDILGSRQVKKAVVDQIGANVILETDRPKNFVLAAVSAARSAVSGLLDSFGPVVEEEEAADGSMPTIGEERAIKRLDRRTVASAGKNSNVITIASKAGTPKLAQSIAQATLDAFIQEHLRLNRTEGSFDFFVEQATKVEQQLTELQDQLQKMKSGYQLVTVDGKRVALEQKLREIELSAVQTDRQLAFAHAKIRDLDRSLGQIDREIVTESESGFGDMAHANMREKLYELEIREGELRQTHAPTHPTMIAVREMRNALAEVLDKQPEARTQTTSALNPTWQALELDLQQQRVDALALEAQQTHIAKQFEVAQRELKQLNAQAVEIAAVQREVDLTEANYRIHTEKLEQARIDSELGSKDISNVNVVQPASYVRKPVRPKKSLVLAGGFILGVLGAIGIALSSEYLDSSLRTIEQTEAHLGIPVVMTIPSASRFEPELSLKGARHASS